VDQLQYYYHALMPEKSAYHEELVFEDQQEVNQTKFLVPAAVFFQMATMKPLLERIQLKYWMPKELR
jgi:hypothetical protein